MVMRNQHGGASSGGWWDDLPPAVKKRVPRPEPCAEARRSEPADPEPYRPALASDLSRLAVAVLALSAGLLVYLLIALSFLSGRGPLAQ